MKRKCLISTLLILVMLCTGCASKDNKETVGNGSTPEKVENNVELSFWNIVDDPNNAMSLRFEESIKQVEEELGITIKYEAINGQTYHTKLKVALAGNQLPDIFIVHPGNARDPFITAEAVSSLNDTLDNTEIGKKFYEGYLQADEEGDIYSVPFRADMAEVMFYNKKIFNEVGIDVPKNWEEFKNAVIAIREKGYAPIGLGNKDRWMGDLLYNTMVLREDPKAFEKAIKGEIDFTDKAFLDGAKKVQELVKLDAFQKGYMGAIEPEVVEMFESDKIAMYFIGTWAFDDLIGRLGDNLGYAPFPAIGADSQASESICGTRNVKPWGFMVSSKSKHVDLAKEALLKFVDINNELTVKQGGIPYMETSVLSEKEINPEFAKYIEDIKNVKFIQTYWADFLPKDKGEPYRDLNQKLFSGDLDPQKYVEEQQKIISE
ncbi:extracellular solute-binding protein [Vallitalea sediminicola]